MKLAETNGVPLDKLTLADLKSLNPLFEEDVMKIWSYENSAQSRNSAGEGRVLPPLLLFSPPLLPPFLPTPSPHPVPVLFDIPHPAK